MQASTLPTAIRLVIGVSWWGTRRRQYTLDRGLSDPRRERYREPCRAREPSDVPRPARVLASRSMAPIERAMRVGSGLLLLLLLARPAAAAAPARPARATVEQALRAHDLGPGEAE